MGAGSMVGKSSLSGDTRIPISQVADGRMWLEQDLFSAAPLSVAVEKLRGFVADAGCAALRNGSDVAQHESPQHGKDGDVGGRRRAARQLARDDATRLVAVDTLAEAGATWALPEMIAESHGFAAGLREQANS